MVNKKALFIKENLLTAIRQLNKNFIFLSMKSVIPTKKTGLFHNIFLCNAWIKHTIDLNNSIFFVCGILWSYASHGAQCGVTTCHSTCCGHCVRDYHISFRL